MDSINQNSNSTTIYLGCVPVSLDQEDIRGLCRPYGRLVSVYSHVKHETDVFCVYFVRYENQR